MLSLGIIVSHRSTSRGMLPESTRSSLDTAIARLNHAFKGKAKVEIALDYEGFRDLSKNEQTQQSIKKSIIELRDAYDELLFLLLVDGELGEGMKNELAYAKEVNKQLPANKRIMIEALIRQRDDYSEVSYPELMDKRNETLPVCTWYSDDRDFKNEAYRIINEILASRLGRPIFPSVLWKILLAILIVLLGWLFYKQCSAEESPLETPQLEAESAITDNETPGIEFPEPSKVDSKEVDTSSGGEEEGRNNSASVRPDGTAWTNEQKLEGQMAYLEVSTQSLTGDYPQFKQNVKNGLSELKIKTTEDKRKALWTITITGTARKYNETNGSYFAYVDMSLDIINTVTGESIYSGAVSVPNSKREGIKGGSRQSYDAAAIEAYKNAYPLVKREINKIK